jgi:precorrin-2 dehydrogenase/sirohydrochlorin ferrochelatase
MKDFYPVMLHLKGKEVVVVGGGKIAERKVHGLLKAGARISLVSPSITEGLNHLVCDGEVDWKQRVFSADLIKDAFMIFAVTDDKDINLAVKAAASPHQLVMLADDPDESDFHVPAHFQQGRLNVAISTGGSSPILSARIRDQLEQQFDDNYAEFLEFLFDTRQWILKEVTDPSLKRNLLTVIASERFLNSSDRVGDFEKLYKELTTET